VGVRSRAIMPPSAQMIIIEGYVEDICRIMGVPESIVKGVIWQESKYDIYSYRWNDDNPNDRSFGLMHLTMPTANEIAGVQLKQEDLYEPIFNIYLGTQYLLNLYQRYKDWSKAVAAYNAGSPRYTQAGMFINQSYVNIVFKAAQILKDSVINYAKLLVRR